MWDLVFILYIAIFNPVFCHSFYLKGEFLKKMLLYMKAILSAATCSCELTQWPLQRTAVPEGHSFCHTGELFPSRKHGNSTVPYGT